MLWYFHLWTWTFGLVFIGLIGGIVLALAAVVLLALVIGALAIGAFLIWDYFFPAVPDDFRREVHTHG